MLRFGRKNRSITYDSENEVQKALVELTIFIIFLILTTIVVSSAQHLYMFYFNSTIEKLFLQRDAITKYGYVVAFSDVVSISDWWDFLQYNLIDDLHGERYLEVSNTNSTSNDTQASEVPSGENNTKHLMGHIFLNENLLLGPPRLRQIRVMPDTCFIHDELSRYFNTCYAEYSKSAEQHDDDYKGSPYYTMSELSTLWIWAQIKTYWSGGYVKELTFDRDVNVNILADLKKQEWIDRGTRVVFVEMSMYNENTNIFENVKFIAEHPPTGGVVPSAQLQAFRYNSMLTEPNIFVLIVTILFAIMILYYGIQELYEFCHFGCRKYFRSLWNYVDASIVLLACIGFIYNIWHMFYVKNILEDVRDEPNTFRSLDIIAFLNLVYIDMIAIMGFLVWIKLFKYISFNKTLLQFSTTLKRCSKDMLGFGLMFLIIFLAYAQLGLLLFGSQHADFRSMKDSSLTMMRMILGDFDYAALEEANRILGPIYFLTYILLVFFILLNMFLAIVLETYSAVKSEIQHGQNHLDKYLAKLFRKIYNFCCCCCSKKFRQEPEDGGKDDDQSTVTDRNTEDNRNILRIRRSQILKDTYSEEYSASKTQREIKRLNERVALLEDVLEKLIGNLDKVLKKIEKKRKAK